MSGRSGLVQSASVKTWPCCCLRPGQRDGDDEDVSTTRLTPACVAAFSTRTAPSRAGRMTSSGCWGSCSGNGEATCSTIRAALHRLLPTVVAQEVGRDEIHAARVGPGAGRRSCAPPRREQVAQGRRARQKPLRSSSAMQCLAMKPDAPVTRTFSPAIASSTRAALPIRRRRDEENRRSAPGAERRPALVGRTCLTVSCANRPARRSASPDH